MITGRPKTDGRWAALLRLAVILWSFIPIAAATPEGVDSSCWNVVELMREREQVSRASARFTEERHSTLLEAPLILSGTLRYIAPSYVEKRTSTPFEERYAVDKDTLLLERPEKRTRTLSLREHPTIWAFVESFRATLSGDLKTLERFYQIRLHGSRQRWRLELIPLDKGMRKTVESIEFEGRQSQIIRIEVREVSGDRSRMTIYPDRS